MPFRLQVKEHPFRVWSLMDIGKDDRPSLPIHPKHNQNAFMEDHLHDWTFAKGTLSFFSRVIAIQEGAWILIEYPDIPMDCTTCS